MSPTVTIGCVTNRLECRQWLRWNVLRQTYRPIQIITVDASVPFNDERGLVLARGSIGAVETLELRPGTDFTCGQLRNLVIAHARGQYLVWMDDDDWYHPERITWLVEAIKQSRSWGAGWWTGYLFDVGCYDHATVIGHPSAKRLINGAAIYDLEKVRDTPYTDRRRASDGRWIVDLMKKHGDHGHLLSDDRIHGLFSRHRANTSPTRFSAGRRLSFETIRERVGDAWGDTDVQLRALEAALAV